MCCSFFLAMLPSLIRVPLGMNGAKSSDGPVKRGETAGNKIVVNWQDPQQVADLVLKHGQEPLAPFKTTFEFATDSQKQILLSMFRGRDSFPVNHFSEGSLSHHLQSPYVTTEFNVQWPKWKKKDQLSYIKERATEDQIALLLLTYMVYLGDVLSQLAFSQNWVGNSRREG